MGLSLYVVLGSAVVGLLVGLTGAGGGALMTPMLILLFSVKPAAAISSDLVAAVVMRPLGSALLVGAAAMVFRYVLDQRSGQARTGMIAEVAIRPVPTVLIGMAGGLIVGITSVGSGSLMIILLLFTYPMLSAGQLVGTDLTQRSRSPRRRPWAR